MRAGLRDQRVTIQTPSATRDAIGGESVTWSAIAVVWASVEPVAGRELHTSDQRHAVQGYKVRILTRSNVTPRERVIWSGRVLTIDAVQQRPRTNETVLLCTEGMRDD